MSNKNNNQSQKTNAESLPISQKVSSKIMYVIYAVILGVLYLIVGILEMINYLAFGLSLDDFEIELFAETEDYITWGENSIMSLS
ncbi:MAG: hypothetical protein ACTSYA_00620, partial [Candidatus Kariarchaeaceae archaeon]